MIRCHVISIRSVIKTCFLLFLTIFAEHYQAAHITAPVKIGRGAWIAINVVILPGVTIGENSIVAAGSVVTKDVPPYTVVGGSPARELKKITPANNPTT